MRHIVKKKKKKYVFKYGREKGRDKKINVEPLYQSNVHVTPQLTEVRTLDIESFSLRKLANSLKEISPLPSVSAIFIIS